MTVKASSNAALGKSDLPHFPSQRKRALPCHVMKVPYGFSLHTAMANDSQGSDMTE